MAIKWHIRDVGLLLECLIGIVLVYKKVMNTIRHDCKSSIILLQPHVDETTASEEIITIKDIRPVLPESKEDIKKCKQM